MGKYKRPRAPVAETRNVAGGLWPLLIGFAKAFGVAMMRHAGDHLAMADARRRALLDARDADPRWNHPYIWSGVRMTGTGT